jgi:kynurenine formamidase
VSAWGRWGKDDQRGAANLIDAGAVRRAVATVRTGEVLSLALPFRRETSSSAVGRPPLQHFMLRDGADYAAGRPERGGFGFADDCVMMATHGGTHLDALSHVWQDGLMYNGFPASSVSSSGARACGIEQVGPLVTRAIFVDLVEDGQECLPAGEAIGAERLAVAVAATENEPQPGDALLLRTGWTEAWTDTKLEADRWPGLDRDCAGWIAERDIAIVGADNVAVEVFPSSDPDCQVPLHVALLRDRGIYFCEMLRLQELAARDRSEFMLVLSPLPIDGAVGSPLNPVAIL